MASASDSRVVADTEKSSSAAETSGENATSPEEAVNAGGSKKVTKPSRTPTPQDQPAPAEPATSESRAAKKAAAQDEAAQGGTVTGNGNGAKRKATSSRKREKPAASGKAEATKKTPATKAARDKAAAKGASTGTTSAKDKNDAPAAGGKKPSAKKPSAKKPSAAAPVSKAGGEAGKPPAPVPVKGEPQAAALAAQVAAQPVDASLATAPSPDDEPEPAAGGGRFFWLQAVPSWMVSMIVHAILLLVLAYLTVPDSDAAKRLVTVLKPPPEIEEVEEELDPQIAPVDFPELTLDAPMVLTELAEPDLETMPEFDDLDAAPMELQLDQFAEEFAPLTDLMTPQGTVQGRGLEGRGAEARTAMAERFGASRGSEAAVAAALRWLAEHQDPEDGGWSFDHQIGPCQGRCANPGSIPPARMGATAMALLPFLGAGQTHREGEYRQVVERGLYFLLSNMRVRNNTADMTDRGGRMYSHGLASIALCEAYAMTNDPALMQPAQLALNYIVYAQDPVGGGWRYQPRQAGDTSVVGWQLMALKSGHMAYLRVPPQTILLTTKFLDSVQVENGAKYGYTTPAGRPSTTSVGLLCRMYLGWKQDEPALRAGVDFLDGIGPTESMYYNYYATQVMRHYEGEHWERWNERMRDRLVETQETRGHATGSWYFPADNHAGRGGRLYCTSMATMILEVYYRHMPIYGRQAAEEEFPL